MNYRFKAAKSASAAVFVLVCLSVMLADFLIALAQPAPDETGKKKPNQLDVMNSETISRLEIALTRLRGLDFKEPLKVGLMKKEEVRVRLEESVAKESSEDYEKFRQALVKLGFLPFDFDLRKFFIDTYTSSILGFYDPEVKELYLVSDAEGSADSGLEEMFGIPVNTMSAVHEMTHALQDQNFDMDTLPVDSLDNDDSSMTVRALIEGEATFIMRDYIFRQRGGDITLFSAGAFNPIDLTPFSSQTIINSAPLYLREGMLFPYTVGFDFVRFVKARGGWELINEAYSDLPASTEQIIHPEKYLSERDYPTAITLPDTSKIITTTRWSLLWENVMGEFNMAVLKKQFFPTRTSKRMSEGWGGDKFALWEDTVDKHTLMIWYTTWDTDIDAWEFFNGYQKLIAEKYKGENSEFPKATVVTLDNKARDMRKTVWSLERIKTSTPTQTSTLSLVSIEQRGKDVLVIEDIPKSLHQELADTLWSKSEKSLVKELKRVPPRKKDEDTKASDKTEKDENKREKPQEPIKAEKATEKDGGK